MFQVLNSYGRSQIFGLWKHGKVQKTGMNTDQTRIHEEINPLTPNDHYSGRTVPLTSKRCILYIYSTNIDTEYFKNDIYSPYDTF